MSHVPKRNVVSVTKLKKRRMSRTGHDMIAKKSVVIRVKIVERRGI